MEEEMMYATMEFKDVNEAERTLAGFVSVPGVDLQNDFVLPGAFSESFAKNPNPIVVYNHDSKDPVGRVLEHRISEAGLWVRVLISKTATRVWQLVREGILKSFSFGFFIRPGDSIKNDEGTRIIRNLSLQEISIVGMPANEGARILEISNAKIFGDVGVLDLKRQIHDLSLEYKNQERDNFLLQAALAVLEISEQLEEDRKHDEKVSAWLENFESELQMKGGS